MTTAFDTAAVDLLDDDDLAVAATFTPASGPAVSCRVFLAHDQQLAGIETSGQVVSLGTTVEYGLADIGRAVRSGETFTVGAVVYTVQDQVANDGITATVVVV